MKRDPWHYGTWEGARDATRENNLLLTLAEKIRALEDMEELAVRFNRQRHREGLPLDPKIAPLIESMVAEPKSVYLPEPPSSP